MGAHDQNFKNLILDYLRESLEFFAQSEAAFFTPDVTITPLREEQIKEWMGDRGAILDVPVIVKWPHGEQAGLIFCFEHNTQDAKDLIKRHALYCIKMSMLYDTDRVVPVAIFPEAEGAVKESFEFSGGAETYLSFKCLTVKLKELSAPDYADSKNIVARLCMLFMRSGSMDKFDVIASVYSGLAELETDWDKRRKYIEFTEFYGSIQEDEFDQYQKRCVEHNPMKEEIMTIAQVLHNRGVREGKLEGKLEGKVEGKVEGKAEGKAELLVKLFRDGMLNRKQAQTGLEQLVSSGEISRVLADEAMTQLNSK